MAPFLVSPYRSKYIATAVPKTSRINNLLIYRNFLRFGGSSGQKKGIVISIWIYQIGIIYIAME